MPNDSSPNPILAFSINPEFVVVGNKAVVQVVYLRVAHCANKAAFVKHMIFHCHMFKNVHRSATFWLVSPVCLNYRAVGSTAWHFDGYPAKQATLLNETKSMHITACLNCHLPTEVRILNKMQKDVKKCIERVLINL